jgi:hypothetical protein
VGDPADAPAVTLDEAIASGLSIAMACRRGRSLDDLQDRHHPGVFVVEDVAEQDRLSGEVGEADPDDDLAFRGDASGTAKWGREPNRVPCDSRNW